MVICVDSREKVSIHATLAGGDFPSLSVLHYLHVSIHATLAGGDFASNALKLSSVTFLSTPPSRVATMLMDAENPVFFLFLSTPPSRVATVVLHVNDDWELVSIHATLAGGDVGLPYPAAYFICFYPRHPRGWRG